MYSSSYYRRRFNGGSFYQAFFWLLVGFLVGQVIRLDINLLAQSETPKIIQPTTQQTF